MTTSGAVYKTLMLMLQAAPSMSGVSVNFGEEYINAQDVSVPSVTIVPNNGTWIQPGYYEDGNVDLDALWMDQESIDLYLWSYDTDPAATPVDHADAVGVLKTLIAQAFQTQAPYGLMFRPVSGRWETAKNELYRYGRLYILTIQVDITHTTALPVNATVLETTLNPSIS